MDFISQSICREHYPNKGIGYQAITDIPKNTLIMSEIPKINLFDIKLDDPIHEILYMIYRCMNYAKDEFMKLSPRYYRSINLMNLSSSNNSADRKKEISSQISHFSKQVASIRDRKIRDYFDSMGDDELLLYLMKYISNVFAYWTVNSEPTKKERFLKAPVILFNGSVFNHSCIPNVAFICEDSAIKFITIRDIKVGEELCISYLNISLDRYMRQNILNQYGFRCSCDRCEDGDGGDGEYIGGDSNMGEFGGAAPDISI
jgi:hypothetical protein